jgi:hypothetical protein
MRCISTEPSDPCGAELVIRGCRTYCDNSAGFRQPLRSSRWLAPHGYLRSLLAAFGQALIE